MIKPLVNMSAHEGRDGKRFLEGLILRAEDVLAKMIYKVHKNLVTLDEMVPMINSVYGFVNTWEKSLADINLDLVVAGGSKSNETSVMEQINKLDFKDPAVEKKPEKSSRKKHSLKDEEEAEPVFEYLEPSLKDYTPDRKGIAVITHAIPGSASFYMVERDDSNKVEQVLLSLQNVTTQLADLPESSSTVFGVSLDNQIFRAVRSTAGFCGIPFLRLLDTGEVLPYIETMPLFKLPEYYQRFAPFAVRCNLIGVMDEPSCKNFTKYLEKNLYVTKQFKVCSRKKSTLNVSLGRVPQSKRNGKVQPRKPEVTPEYKISEKTLTQEQLDILYEETECTSNAMKATMGFIPKDDERICPFYDPQIEGCFKGSRCRLRHEAKDPDGWTKDRAFHKLKIRAQMIEPQIGQVLKMVPTAIVSMEEFYGQLYSTQSVKELSELQNRLNDPKVVKKLRRMDHTPYHPNRTGCCVISYVGPAKLSFCLVDRGQPDCTKIIAAMQNARGTRLTQLPAPGEVFGVFLDGSLFRAVRNKVVENTPLKTAYLRLLDTGEIVPYEEDFMLCSLSEYYRKIPAFALRCVLVNVLDDPFCDDLHNYLQNNLHTNQYYKVVSAEKSVLFLKLSQQPILPADGDSQPTVSSKISSSPRLDIFKPNSTPAYNAAPTIRPSVSMEKEKSSCPFFDSVRSTCAKGAHRRNESVPEGDNAVGDQYIVPPVGSMVHVVPKFIRGVDHFWCQVVAKDSADCDLLEMETKMNGSESVARYRKLTKPPYFKQRVFALYVDKHWYRAEVARYFDENNVLVFYVDYGNAEIVSMKEIRQWDEKFSYLPYQAVLCRFASVCQVKPNHTQAVVELNRKLLNRRFMAKIMNNSCPWELIIYDEDGFDFSKGLLLAGLAKKPDSNDDDMEDETSAVAA